MTIEKKYHFYAAHRNRAGGEKCGRIHGHTYDVVCHFEFDATNEGGISCLFNDIDIIVEPIIKEHCHYLLLDESDSLVEILERAGEQIKVLPFPTSLENLAVYFLNRIKVECGLPIIKIKISETKSSSVTYEIKGE